MENIIVPSWLTYKSVRKHLLRHWLREFEIPTEHFVSLPLPTQRFGQSAFIVFAAPSHRIIPEEEGEPVESTHRAPDRWCLLSAKTGQILLYSLRSVTDFTNMVLNDEVSTSTGKTVDQLQDALFQLETVLERILPAFFRDEPLQKNDKEECQRLFDDFVPLGQKSAYEEAAPDFFSWLTNR